MAVAPAERDYRSSLQEGRKPLFHELRAWEELRDLHVDPVFYGIGVPHGDNSRVLVLPGFMGSDASLFWLALYLRRINYRVRMPGILLHTDPKREIERLSKEIEEDYVDERTRFHIIGHSLGGFVGRGIANSIPEAIASLNTLGSPKDDDEEAINPIVLWMAKAMIPSFNNKHGLTEIMERLSQPLAAHIRTTHILTKDDAVVDWRSILNSDPQAKYKEVPGTHAGLVVNRFAYRHLAESLHESVIVQQEATHARTPVLQSSLGSAA